MNPSKLAVAVAALLTAAGPALAEDSPLTANIGAVSNYMWRGVTQTQDGAAIQGGLDYAHESGFSLGTWASNVDFGDDDPALDINLPKYELDLYAGYGGKVGDFGYNLSTTYYAYPDGKDADFWELGASGSWNVLTVGLAYTLDGQANDPAPFRGGDFYYYGNLSFDLPMGFKLGGTLGHYDFTDFGSVADYTHWQVSVSKEAGDFGTFSLNYDQNDGGANEIVAVDDDPKVWVGWKKTF